ncbi:uncharacterized protein LOC142349228 isoform X1 [Convolutriloba macropyga]|uniref:uncharacterized protein LOC142349228 isoform X1 n=2 Tax=Convolutriloba macropyga TaxID=536237 RepID=UPI003F521955
MRNENCIIVALLVFQGHALANIIMSDKNGNSNTCDICTNESNDFFYCSSSHDKTDETPFDKKRICRICIGWHLQCNHEVKNQKGLKPLICKMHKMLQLEFCRTCELAFCWGCMSKHSEHKFGSLDEKAAEIKTKVFESLSEFEYEEKLMNSAKKEIVQKIEKHEKKQKTLRETAVAELEKLKEEVLKTIDDNCNIMKEHLKAVNDVVEIQQKLRDLLSVPNDHLVNEFREIDKEMKQLRIASDKMKKEKADVYSCDVGCVVAKVKQFQDSLIADLKSVLIEASFFCWNLVGTGYRTSLEKGKIFVEDAVIDDSGSLSYTDRKTQVLNEEVTHCFSVLDYSNILKILILTSNNSAYVFNPSEANMTLSNVPYPNKTHFLWPYYNQNNQTQPYWSYWEGGAIRFTHNASFTVQCESIPSVRMGQPYHYNWLFFISSDNTVIVADISSHKHTRFTIPDIEHISCVSYNGYSRALFIFSADGTSFYTVYRIQNLQFRSPVKHNWNNQSTVTVRVNYYNFSITKAANPADTQYPHLFKVTRV